MTGAVWFAGYVGSIFLANFLITHLGFVPVWPGLLAPAGVYAAGLAFTCRDFVQEQWGPGASLLAVLVGAALSAFLSPTLALASGVAFLVSETADLVVYTPLRKKGLLPAVLASNVVGLVVDSALFLGLAFGSLEFLPGQLVGKVWATIAALALIWVVRGWRRRDLALRGA